MDEKKLLDILFSDEEIHNDPAESGVFIFDDSDEFIAFLNNLMEVRKWTS